MASARLAEQTALEQSQTTPTEPPKAFKALGREFEGMQA
jgi:hypothetical protein